MFLIIAVERLEKKTMNRKTYYLAASIFIALGILGVLIKLAARTERLTVIVIGCFLVGLVYLIMGSRLRD